MGSDANQVFWARLQIVCLAFQGDSVDSIFNRSVWSNPSPTNALATQTKGSIIGIAISGFERINTVTGTGILGAIHPMAVRISF